MFACGAVGKDMKVPGEEKAANTAPGIKITKFTETLKDFGLMMEIYRETPVRIVLREITDKTGASASTGAEIQQSITEISKSTLGNMGENVVYIEFDPEFLQSMQQTGYSDFSNKIVPEVAITGAITEFDRSLTSWEKGMDAGGEANIGGLPAGLPTKAVSLDYSQSEGQSTSRITVDFNMKKFQTLASIPSMSMTNSMEVNKGMAKKEIGLTLFGPTFGSNGSMKKVQGRHDAVRLLVQSSLLQIVGRYAGVPYWRVFGNDAIPDEVVLQSWKRQFKNLPGEVQLSLLQRYLNLHGYDVDITKQLDSKTKAAFSEFCSKNHIGSNALDADTFLKIYLTVPLTEATYERAQALNAGQNLGAQEPDYGKIANILNEAFKLFTSGDFSGAVSKFDESIKITPSPVAYYYMGMSYQQMKDINKGITALEAGTKAFKGDFALWKNLGLAYNEVGDNAKAKQAFTAANAINPNDRNVKFFMERN
jgi:TolA-binding protein